MIVPDDLIDVAAAAILVKAHPSTVYRWLRRGNLRGWRKGGARYLISRKDLEGVYELVTPRKPVVVPWKATG